MSEEVAKIGDSRISLNPQVYQEPLNIFVQQVAKGKAALNAIEKVEDKPTLEKGAELLNKAKMLSDAINRKVEDICRPLKDAKADIDEIMKAIKAHGAEVNAPIMEAAKSLQGKLVSYNSKLREEAERVRRVNDEMVAEARQKAIEAARAEEKAGNEPAPVPVVVNTIPVVEAPKLKGLTTYWKHEVVDVNLVPKEYLMVDTAKVTAAVKGGCREIPGIRIYPEQIIKKTAN